MTSEVAERWFARVPGRPGAECMLFCLPYSGAGATAYRGWQEAFGPAVEIVPVRLPGREERLGEPHRLAPAEIAAPIAAAAARGRRPYALYGHSLGARLGFDVLRELRRLGAPLPVRLYAAAARPPDEADPVAASVELSDEAFLAALTERLDAPTDLRDLPELRELLLPVLRADFRWLHGYRFRPEAALPVRIVALAGARDAENTPARMLGWSRHTAAGFGLHVVGGDHFFVRTAIDELAEVIADDLRGAARRAARPMPAMPRSRRAMPAGTSLAARLAPAEEGSW
jgi:surfactin synthase thioesterase subunit